MTSERTQNSRFKNLKRRTACIHNRKDGEYNLPIANQLEILGKHLNNFVHTDLHTIEQLMLLSYEEGKYQGAKNARTDATTLPDHRPSHENAPAKGREPEPSQRDSDDTDESGDTTRQAIFFHGHLL